MDRKNRQKERGEEEEWERRGEEFGRTAFGRSEKTRRSPQQEEKSETVEKRKVAETSFEEEGGKKRERKESREREGVGCNGSCRELVESIMREIRKEREIWREEMERARKRWEEELREMKEKWGEEREALRAQIRGLEDEAEKRERRERRNNVVIRGKDFKDKGEVESFLKEVVQVEVEVKESFRVEGGSRITVVKLGGREEKIKIMKNKKRIKETGARVYIDDDMTKKEREIQKIIREKAKREWEMGRAARIGYQKLTIDGKFWRWDNGKGALIEAKNQVI